MDAQSILAELESRGVELQALGGRLRFHPARAVPPHLVEELRSRKAELLRLLTAPAVGDTLAGVRAAQPSILAAEVCEMKLEDFARASLVLEVWSETLREVVVLASDNALLDPGERRSTYRAAELKEMLSFDAVSLKRVHQVKFLFRGTILPA